MKTTHHNIRKLYNRFSQQYCGGPLGLTAQNYQSTAFGGSGGPAQKPEKPASFRDISRSFSRREQLQHVAVELAIFGIITLTAAGGLFLGAAALAQFLAVR